MTVQNQSVAVIDIGTSGIRMVIAEVTPKGDLRFLEHCQKPVSFGKDVFTTGRISRALMQDGIAILKNFKSILDTYGVQHIRTIATSAVREAQNRDNFTDRVFVQTGIDIEVIEGPEHNRLELSAVEHALGQTVDLNEKNSLIVEVGSGSTELIVLHQGHVALARTFSIGLMRLPEQIVPGTTDTIKIQRVLKRSIRNLVKNVAYEYALEKIDTFIALGENMRFVSKQILQDKSEPFTTVDKKPFVTFLRKLSKFSPEEIVNEYGLPYSQAQTLYASLVIFHHFVNETQATHIIVPRMSMKDGLLLEMAQMLSGYKRTDHSKQVINSAQHLGSKYHYDKAHAQCVASLALKIYDQMTHDHGLGVRERLLLDVAAILHDIGSYISSSSHHKHSSYLVYSSEIFGLRKSDKDIVANVVRYHRRSTPKRFHEPYMSLPKGDRVVVAKLAAILRVAEALDKSHQQKIRHLQLEPRDDVYRIWVDRDISDLSVEREALVRRGDMFLEVFGVPLELKQKQLPTT